MKNKYEADREKDLIYENTLNKSSETKKSRITMPNRFKDKPEKNRAKSK